MRLPTIRKQRIFDKLRAIRSGVNSDFLRIVWLSNYPEDNNTEFAFKITRRAGNAVFRNRVRRIIREYLRIEYTNFINNQPCDFVFPEGYKVLIVIKNQISRVDKNDLSKFVRRDLTHILTRFTNIVSRNKSCGSGK